ncbi:MAG: DUF4392 domain-containing protein [Syntrophobacteraceae bacterium]|jgi:hypothetical protein|nr:DUF4392 domain-containing protein [Syntrophobacteraceae bacterium]
MRARIASIENTISQDPAHRNILPLVKRDHLRLAAMSLLKAERVLIVTGFPIKKAGAGETDGPPGAYAVGCALEKLGIPVAYVTDRLNEPLLRAVGAQPLLRWSPDLLSRESYSHLVAVERPGRARDGRYYNMRAEDISSLVSPLDGLFLEAEKRGIVTIGIGDGGNEVGMGKVFLGVSQAVAHGRRIASTVLTDYVIVAGVSNWGAYGLVGALSVVAGRDLLPTPEEFYLSVISAVQAGAVDGVSGLREPSVDGLPLSRSLAVLQDIRWQLHPSSLDRVKELPVAILGAGESGRAAARMLLRHGARVRLSDSARVDLPPDLSGLPHELGAHTLQFLEGAELVIKSPGIPPDSPLVLSIRENGIPILSELEVAFQLMRPNVVAVTGSVGKRDTVLTIGGMAARCGLRVPVGGNKGLPLSTLLAETPADWVALSLSSFQLESTVHFRPRIAAILNVRGEHLDRHGDLVETARIKSRIFMNQGPADTLILNRDDPLVARLAEKHWGETLYVSLTAPVERGAWLEGRHMMIALEDGPMAIGPPRSAHPLNELCAALAVVLLGGDPARLYG